MVDESRRCIAIDEAEVYTKEIMGVRIDPSEWQDERGAYLCTKRSRCPFVAEIDDTLCAKHRLMMESGHSFSTSQ